MELTDIEIYNFFKDFKGINLYFDEEDIENKWFYDTKGMRVPLERTPLEVFARRIQYHIKAAQNIIEKAKKIQNKEFEND